jgi:hypothetical protein
MSRTARLRAKLRKRVKRVRALTRKIARRPLAGYHRAREKNAAAAKHLRKLIDKQPLRDKALAVAEGLVGVMEEGGNNTGEMVDKIITANGGSIGEPWCGDGMAFCYRAAGSKAVTRVWAAVSLLLGALGIRRTSSPKPGDLVRFVFDHVGMFVRDLGNGQIETIEFNTGATGAVSDSATGGDGVYRKVRDVSLVNDYLRVTR